MESNFIKKKIKQDDDISLNKETSISLNNNDNEIINLDHIPPSYTNSNINNNFNKKSNTNEIIENKTEELPEKNKKNINNNFNKINNIQKEEDILNNLQNKDVVLSNIDFDFILNQLKDLLKSPSPLTLYKKSSEIKENFSLFLNNLAKKISAWFNSQNKTVILSMYYNADYQQVWINHLKCYFEDSRYFDPELYFKIVILFDKEKQILAKWLLKLYLWAKKEDILKFLANKNYKTKIKYEKIKETYDYLNLSSFEWQIDKQYLNENKIELFLKKILILYWIDNDKLFSIFPLILKNTKWIFNEIYDIFSSISKNYLKDLNQKDKNIIDFINDDKNISTKEAIDKEIKYFFNEKYQFYNKIENIISWYMFIERWYFWWYIKTKLINKYYSEINWLFYWSKKSCRNRNEWSQLKWNFAFSEVSIFKDEIKSILWFKDLILQLDESLLSPFLKPIIYSIVSEKLSITQKDLLKLRYLMTLVLSENFSEYKTIYNFFEDLETFLDFNMSFTANFTWININYRKLKIFTADIVILFLLLIWLYIYAPIWVFIAIILLSLSYFREHFFSFREWIEWNFWTRTFATVLLVISSFFWITNLDKTKIDIKNLTTKIEKVWIYKTDETVNKISKKIENLEVPEMITNILQWKK